MRTCSVTCAHAWLSMHTLARECAHTHTQLPGTAAAPEKLETQMLFLYCLGPTSLGLATVTGKLGLLWLPIKCPELSKHSIFSGILT